MVAGPTTRLGFSRQGWVVFARATPPRGIWHHLARGAGAPGTSQQLAKPSKFTPLQLAVLQLPSPILTGSRLAQS